MIKAILFDLDGTLLDTDKLIFMTYKYMFDKYRPDYKPSYNEMLFFLGPSLREVFPKYFTEDLHILIEDYRKYNVEHHHFVSPIHGAVETLKKLKEQGYKVGVVTSKRKDVAILGLKRFQMDQYIDFLVDCDMVTKHKPDPMGIEMALKYFNISNDEAIMIGDSTGDILAGKAAGCKTAAVSYSLKGEFYQDLKPNYVLDSLADLFKYI